MNSLDILTNIFEYINPNIIKTISKVNKKWRDALLNECENLWTNVYKYDKNNIFEAIENDDVFLLTCLLNATKIDIETKKKNRTLLQLACYYESENSLELLIKRGADMYAGCDDIMDSRGMGSYDSPLAICAYSPNINCFTPLHI